MNSDADYERGATVVEAALVVPLLFLLVFGLFDLGLWVFDSTQAAAAARDGARAATLDYAKADIAGSPDRLKVSAAATRHVTLSSPSIAVRCLKPDGIEVVCAQATPGVDRVEVTVALERKPLTFVTSAFGARQVSGLSAVAINGRPVSG